jgi:hypothetical protein
MNSHAPSSMKASMYLLAAARAAGVMRFTMPGENRAL